MGYQKSVKKVAGKKAGEIFVFALSTCGWCMKTKAFLKELGVEYSYVDVDLLNDKAHDEVGKELEKLGTDFAFPKVIINGKVISGFDEKAIRKAVGK